MRIDSQCLKISGPSLVYASIKVLKMTRSLKITEKINSQTAWAVAICEPLINQGRLFPKGIRGSEHPSLHSIAREHRGTSAGFLATRSYLSGCRR